MLSATVGTACAQAPPASAAAAHGEAEASLKQIARLAEIDHRGYGIAWVASAIPSATAVAVGLAVDLANASYPDCWECFPLGTVVGVRGGGLGLGLGATGAGWARFTLDLVLDDLDRELVADRARQGNVELPAAWGEGRRANRRASWSRESMTGWSHGRGPLAQTFERRGRPMLVGGFVLLAAAIPAGITAPWLAPGGIVAAGGFVLAGNALLHAGGIWLKYATLLRSRRVQVSILPAAGGFALRF